MNTSTTVPSSVITQNSPIEVPQIYRLHGDQSTANLIAVSTMGVLMLFALFVPVLLVPALFLLTFFGFSYWEGYVRVRLTIRQDGLEYRGFGYVTSTKWDNLERVGEFRIGRSTFQGIILHKPYYESRAWMFVLEALQFPVAIGSALTDQSYRGTELHSYGWVIPIAQFDPNWEDGPIGDALRYYAPQVFIDEERPALIYNRE